jgi:hypothetical protein
MIPGVKLRSWTALLLCLAFLATRVGGLHFHVLEDAQPLHGPEISSHASHDHDHDHDHAPHLTSDLAADHLAGHVDGSESDAGSDAGLIAKLPSPPLLVLLAVIWLAFALPTRMSAGVHIPIRWLRPPDLGPWPTQLLPPSQGPPRAI